MPPAEYGAKLIKETQYKLLFRWFIGLTCSLALGVSVVAVAAILANEALAACPRLNQRAFHAEVLARQPVLLRQGEPFESLSCPC